MKYKHHFRCGTRDSSEQASHYLNGMLLNQGRGNIANYSRLVPESDYQSLHHFITKSPWSSEGVINQIQVQSGQMMGDPEYASLHVDEAGFPKQGNSSAGVKRQYCGRLGKVDNSQVGVFLGYCNGNLRTLIDGRLYLPEDWATDPIRREMTGVPEEIPFETKAQIAYDMIHNAQNNGVPFGWIGGDCFYGEQTWFRNDIDESGFTYIFDVPMDTRVWIDLPQTGVPMRKGKKGRIPTKEKVLDGEDKPVEVSKIKHLIPPEQWKRVFVRETERKDLYIDIVALRVHPVDNKLPGKEVWLIIRKEDGVEKVKYHLSNAPGDTNLNKLAKMACSRYWIERALEDAKGLAGLAGYELRSWQGWHHHIAMSLLAMLAMLTMKIKMGDKADMLTIHDVKQILENILPRKEFTRQDILQQIKEKHRARLSAKESHHRRNGYSNVISASSGNDNSNI
jgi:SRSO17 transposase